MEIFDENSDDKIQSQNDKGDKMPSLMSIRVEVDSEAEGIESIVPFAASLVTKAKICFFLYQIYCKFWKKKPLNDMRNYKDRGSYAF